VSRLILDAGAFIALDRNERAMWARLALAHRGEQKVLTHAGIVGQVWRRPSRQARLATALSFVEIRPLTTELAKAAGVLLADTRTSDVHDAALALICQDRDVVFTSDVSDLSALLGELRMTMVGLIGV
jgi:PIN domain nuclease of toxin-antitoxin system